MTTQTQTQTTQSSKPRKTAQPREVWEPGTVLVASAAVMRGKIEYKYVVVADRHAVTAKGGNASTKEQIDTVLLDGHKSRYSHLWRGGLKAHDDYAIVVPIFSDSETCVFSGRDCRAIRRAEVEVLTPEVEQRAKAQRLKANHAAARRDMLNAQGCVRDGVIRWALRQVGISVSRYPSSGESALMHQMATVLIEKGVVPAPIVPSLREWQVLSSLAGLACDLSLNGDRPCLSDDFDDGDVCFAGVGSPWPSCAARFYSNEEEIAYVVKNTKVAYPTEGAMFDLDDEERLAECAARL